MCGIIYSKSFNHKPVNNLILQQFQAQKMRGRQGFGVFDGEYKNMVKTPKEDTILKWLKRYPSNELMFHHRFPTSTANVKNAAHPFSTKDFFGDNQYILVHNGILWNERELQEEHEKLGIVYSSVQPNGQFNDSEALLWDVALYLEGKQTELKAEGSIAFICMALNEGNDKLYFARNSGSPLNMQFNKKRLSLSSEGRGSAIDVDRLYCFTYATQAIHKFALAIPTYRSTYSHSPAQTSFGVDDFDSGYYDEDGIFRPFRGLEPEDKEHEALDFTDPNTMEADIKEAVNEYLEYADGYYALAVDMIDEEVNRLEDTQEYDTLTFYEVQILEAAKEVLIDDPFWIDLGENVQHPKYAPKSSGVQHIGSLMVTNHADMADKIARQYEADKVNAI